jgi:hypothetical protein
VKNRDVITIEEARELVEAELMHLVLLQDRHHYDQAKEWWYVDDFEMAVELAHREQPLPKDGES